MVDTVTTLTDIHNTSFCPYQIFMYSLVDSTLVIFMCILVCIVFGVLTEPEFINTVRKVAS